MSTRTEVFQALVSERRETLGVELKSWIDPKSPEGIQKIARAALALRNQNGGYLIVGFNDTTCQPEPVPAGIDVRVTYHTDEIQRIVSRYASPAFVVEVHYPEIQGISYPVIQIPRGLKTPVVCKADLTDASNGRVLLREKDIYVRTVATNGTISSARGNAADIAGLVERCFENREADQTVLLSKVFQAIPGADLPEIFNAIGRMAETGIDAIGGLEAILEDGDQRYHATMGRRSSYHSFLGFLDIALIIRGLTRHWEPTFDFLRVLKAANPRLSAWPIWQVSDDRADQAEHPHFLNDRFEAYLYYPYSSGQRRRGALDFMIFDPKGRFFSRRAFQDDMGPQEEGRATRTLEIYLQAWQIAEALAVGRSFARALGSAPETTLNFLFRWSGIRGRKIDLWAHPGAEFLGTQNAQQEFSKCEVTLAATANDEELIAKAVYLLKVLVRPFGDMRIPESYVSSHIRSDVFGRELA
jgi:hypothetical protein